MTRTLAFVFLVSLADTSAAQTNGSPNACGAAELQRLVGLSSDVIEYISRHVEVRRVGVGGPLRISPVLVWARLNFEQDASGTITRVYCG